MAGTTLSRGGLENNGEMVDLSLWSIVGLDSDDRVVCQKQGVTMILIRCVHEEQKLGAIKGTAIGHSGEAAADQPADLLPTPPAAP